MARRCLINKTEAIGKTANKTADGKSPGKTETGGGKSEKSGGKSIGNNKSGMVVGVDLSVVDAVDGVVFVCGDFLHAEVVDEVRGLIAAGHHHPAADVVVSDMSPNLSGIAVRDQSNAATLARAAMDFAAQVLKPGGAVVVKCFEGEEFGALRARARREYRKVAVFRPPATKTKSREVYIVGRGFFAIGG